MADIMDALVDILFTYVEHTIPLNPAVRAHIRVRSTLGCTRIRWLHLCAESTQRSSTRNYLSIKQRTRHGGFPQCSHALLFCLYHFT